MSQVLWCPIQTTTTKSRKRANTYWKILSISPTLTMMPLHTSDLSHNLDTTSDDDPPFPVNICNNLGQFSLSMILKNTLLKKSLTFIMTRACLCADLDMAPNMTSGHLPLNWLIVQHLATGIRWWSQCSAAFPRDFYHNFSSLYFNLWFYVPSCLMWFLLFYSTLHSAQCCLNLLMFFHCLCCLFSSLWL
jgi:hypothetical protein